MWWKVFLAMLGLTGLFFVLGLYAGAAAYLQVTTGSTAGMGLTTLFDANAVAMRGVINAYLPWAWALTAAITLFPIGVLLLAYFSSGAAQNWLHGNARFANDRELKQFAYKGEYH